MSEPRVLVAFRPCGCWAGSATGRAYRTAGALANGARDRGWLLAVMGLVDARRVTARCRSHAATGAGPASEVPHA